MEDNLHNLTKTQNGFRVFPYLPSEQENLGMILGDYIAGLDSRDDLANRTYSYLSKAYPNESKAFGISYVLTDARHRPPRDSRLLPYLIQQELEHAYQDNTEFSKRYNPVNKKIATSGYVKNKLYKNVPDISLGYMDDFSKAIPTLPQALSTIATKAYNVPAIKYALKYLPAVATAQMIYEGLEQPTADDTLTQEQLNQLRYQAGQPLQGGIKYYE